MFKSKTLILLLVLTYNSLSWGQTPLAKERVIEIDGAQYRLTSKLKSVVNLNFTFGYHHNDGKPLINETIQRLAEQEGWEYEYVTNHSQVNSNLLSSHQVVVGNNISGFNTGTFSNTSEEAVQQFIENGGGFFSFHGTGDGEGNQWPWYEEVFHPVDYQGHANRTNCNVYVEETAREHVIFEGLEQLDDVTMYGEWYRMGEHITKNAPDAELLWYATVENCRGVWDAQHIHEEGQHIMWVIPIEKGKHLYFPFGHDALEVDPFPGNSWEQLIKQGLYYVAGYDTVALAPAKGCTDPAADNTTADATEDDGTCTYTGCPNQAAENYFCKTNNDAFPCVASNGYTAADISDDSSCAVSINRQKFGNPSMSVRHMNVFIPDPHAIQITNVNGAVVFSQNASEAGNYDLSKLQPGLYIIKAVTSRSTETQKVLLY